MRQGKGGIGVLGEETAIRIREPIEHRIGRRHAGQRDVETVRRTASHQAMGEHQRRLRLAAAGLVLDHEQGRAGR